MTFGNVTEQALISDVNYALGTSKKVSVQFGSYMLDPPATPASKPVSLIGPKKWWV